MRIAHFSAVMALGVTLFMSGRARAGTDIILDGSFLDPIGKGSNLTPWSDWTSAGITRNAAPQSIGGNYASLPVGADLFQRFTALANGSYVLSFQVKNEATSASELVFAVQEELGTPVSTVFAAGTGEELTLAPSAGFTKETLTFTINNPSFVPNELTFSNSYDAPVSPISNSINPNGTLIDIANVSLEVAEVSSATPEPSTWATLLVGLISTGASLRFSHRKTIRFRRSLTAVQ